MNIMEIVSGKRVNSAIIHPLLLTRELARRGHRVTLVCRPGAWIGNQVAEDPVEVIRCELTRWPTDELRRIAQVIRQQEIDVVHTHMSRAHAFGVLLRWFARTPSVATAQSRHVQLHWMFNDRVIAVSDATRRYHATYNLVRDDRIVTIPNFVGDRPRNARAEVAREETRRELQLANDAIVLGSLGERTFAHGLQHLVRALPRIVQAAPRASLVVIGQKTVDDQTSEVCMMAAKLGVADRLVWTAPPSDLSALLAALDLFVMPSANEVQPLALLEAMAAGLPVVTTSAAGMAEYVDHGRTGLLVRPDDSEVLAKTIVSLIEDENLRIRLGAEARKHFRRRFSPETVVPAIEGVFEDVASQRRAA